MADNVVSSLYAEIVKRRRNITWELLLQTFFACYAKTRICSQELFEAQISKILGNFEPTWSDVFLKLKKACMY